MNPYKSQQLRDNQFNIVIIVQTNPIYLISQSRKTKSKGKGKLPREWTEEHFPKINIYPSKSIYKKYLPRSYFCYLCDLHKLLSRCSTQTKQNIKTVHTFIAGWWRPGRRDLCFKYYIYTEKLLQLWQQWFNFLNTEENLEKNYLYNQAVVKVVLCIQYTSRDLWCFTSYCVGQFIM